jgi:hypothetical protein
MGEHGQSRGISSGCGRWRRRSSRWRPRAGSRAWWRPAWGPPACRSWWSIRRRFGLRPFAGQAGEDGSDRCAPVSEGVIARFAVATRPTIRPLADADTTPLADLIARRRQITQMPNPRKDWGRGAAREAGVEADEEEHLARISHRGQVHRGPERGKVLLRQRLEPTREGSRCRQSVARGRWLLRPSMGGGWWRISLAGRSLRTPGRYCWG